MSINGYIFVWGDENNQLIEMKKKKQSGNSRDDDSAEIISSYQGRGKLEITDWRKR